MKVKDQMKKFLLSVLLLSLISTPCLSEIMDDLVKQDGIYYKRFIETPFTGVVTGRVQGRFENGKKEGEWIIYNTGGEFSNKGNYKSGKQEGEWVYYHYNGQLFSKGSYKNGKPEGQFVTYHDNGQLGFKGNYKSGKKEGNWVSYKNNGTVYQAGTGTFKNGQKVSD